MCIIIIILYMHENNDPIPVMTVYNYSYDIIQNSNNYSSNYYTIIVQVPNGHSSWQNKFCLLP